MIYQNLTPEQLELLREQDPIVKAQNLGELLTKGVLTIVFTKKDGTTTMRPLTLSAAYIPANEVRDATEVTKKRVEERAKGYVSAYDLSKDSWSKVHAGSIVEISTYMVL